MSPLVLIVTLLLLSTIGYYLGRGRAVAVAQGELSHLHSLPSYHGAFVALWCALPSLLLVAAWLALEPQIAEWFLISSLPAETRSLPADRLSLPRH